MIGIGGAVYLSLDNKVIGAFLFSFGLLTIIIQGFNLFTGKIGFISTIEQVKAIPLMIAGNFIGTYIAALLIKLSGLPITEKAIAICENKLSNTPFHIFILAVFCGILMYLAVDSYNKNKNLLFIILPVVIFILSGFEHSIADMFYFSLYGIANLKVILYICIILLGNAIGALVFSNVRKLSNLN